MSSGYGVIVTLNLEIVFRLFDAVDVAHRQRRREVWSFLVIGVSNVAALALILDTVGNIPIPRIFQRRIARGGIADEIIDIVARNYLAVNALDADGRAIDDDANLRPR